MSWTAGCGEWFTSPVTWASHLEGSYVVKAALRRLDPRHTPWLYVDNGSRVLERSDHDNTAVTRWVLCEHGVVLAGADPKDLIDPVTTAELRQEVTGVIPEWTGATGPGKVPEPA